MAASDDKPDEEVTKMEPPGERRREGEGERERKTSLSAQVERERERDKGSERTSSPSQQQQQQQGLPRRIATAPGSSLTHLAAVSPKPSRETSPVRAVPVKPGHQQIASRRSRSRRNSQDLSPSRTSSTPTTSTGPDVPSAAAVQRALSATGLPRLASPTSQEPVGDSQKVQRAARGAQGASSSSHGGSHAAAAAARVKSPPRAGALNRSGMPSSRKTDPAPSSSSTPSTPSIVVESGLQKVLADIEDIEEEDENENETEDEPTVVRSGLRSPSRAVHGGSILEAVQEAESPESSAINLVLPQMPQQRSSQSSRPSGSREEVTSPDPTLIPSATQSAAESGSESAGSRATSINRTSKGEGVLSSTQSTPKASAIKPKTSLSQFPPTSTKSSKEGSVRSMTVETETVTSVPQLVVGAATSDRGSSIRSDAGGTIRLKPSSETIRPKKERKTKTRKTPSIHSGTASSKADIFEAKVASAVDEADSSDSEETFVYESNPPEPPTRVSTRYHSRTPSATSMASTADHYGNRGHTSIVGKKSMKFTNNQHHFNNYQGDGENSSTRGTVGSSGTGNGSHHIGRHGRNTQHASLFDNDSPFSTAGGKSARNSPRAHLSPRPANPANPPRSPYVLRSNGNGKFKGQNSYDIEGEGADDERTPLIPGSRHGRTRHSRRAGGGRYVEPASVRSRGFIRSLLGWSLLGLLIAALIAAIIVVLVLCSKPLKDVHIGVIRNVIATEEEVLFDLQIYATNPNIVSIQVDKLDMKIFAKSKNVRPSRLSDGGFATAAAHQDSNLTTTGGGVVHGWDNVDEGTDPIGEPEGADTMLLGRVYNLDSPLTFTPSPFNQQRSSDFGEISFAKPGNRTADDGSDRWKIVVRQPFELIVVGQIKYTLPISSKVLSVSVGRGQIHVEPATQTMTKPQLLSSSTHRMAVPWSS